MSIRYIKKRLPSLPTAVNETGNPQPYPTDISNRKVYVIKADRWDKSFPYYFSVLKASKGDGSTEITSKVDNFKDFPLPLNPSSIQISVPFAINVSATTRGILEEHNGTVFRNIVIQGTTGVTPGLNRAGGYSKPGTAGKFSSELSRAAIILGANTLDGVSNSLRAFQRTVSAATGDYPDLVDATADQDIWQFGHAQLHLLLNYFVAYSEFKKNATEDGKLARLAFVSQKDNTAYIVTPVSFDVNKSAEKPHQFDYRIVLKAWDIADTTGLKAASKTPFALEQLSNNPNLITRLFQTLREARAVISSAQGAIRAVASDFESGYKIIKEVMLVIKELGGLGRTLADFDELVESRWVQIARDFDSKIDEINNEFGGNAPASQMQRNIVSSLSTISESASATTNSLDPTNPRNIPVQSLTKEERDRTQKKSDTQNPFNNTSSLITHTDLLDTYSIDDFVLNDFEQDRIDNTITAINTFTIADYDKKRKQIENIRDAYADSRQLGDPTYDSVVNRTTVVGLRRNPTTQDYLILKSFNDIVSVIDALSATNELIRQNIPDPFARAQAAVADSDININSSNSAFPVPFPYKGTLEGLASLYLGDPDRWIEIALINNLKPPYIDEEGFIYSFTSSGSGNTLTIGSVVDLYLGQEIFLSSSTKREEKRIITNIEKIDGLNWLITVDGDDNLSEFIASQQARLKAFKPNTVNSSKIIYIPLAITVPDSQNVPDTKLIPSTQDLSLQERLMGADIMLTDDFDLAVGPTNDVLVTTGFRNALQALKIKLAVEPGELKQHQEFGAGIPIGERQEFTAQDLKQYIEAAITSDPRFENIPDISVTFDGPSVILDLRVSTVNNSGVIPIRFVL